MLLNLLLAYSIYPFTHPPPLTNPPSYPVYLWAAVWCGGAPVEMVLGKEEGRAGHVQDGVVHQHNLTEVKLVGETLPFGFVQNTLVVVIPAKERERILMEGWSEVINGKGRGKGKEVGRINIIHIKVLCFITISKV